MRLGPGHGGIGGAEVDAEGARELEGHSSGSVRAAVHGGDRWNITNANESITNINLNNISENPSIAVMQKIFYV
jgi:hypothetical protein